MQTQNAKVMLVGAPQAVAKKHNKYPTHRHQKTTRRLPTWFELLSVTAHLHLNGACSPNIIVVISGPMCVGVCAMMLPHHMLSS